MVEDYNFDYACKPFTLNRIDTSNNSVTATLPLAPKDKDEIHFLDSAGSDPNNPTGFGKNFLIIEPNGATIQGYSDILTLEKENSSISLIYHAVDNDWDIIKASLGGIDTNSVIDTKTSLVLKLTDQQTIPNNTSFVPVWDEVDNPQNLNIDGEGYIEIVKAGGYFLLGNGDFSANTNGDRIAGISVKKPDNSITTLATSRYPAAFGFNSRIQVLAIPPISFLKPQDKIRLELAHSAGSDLTLESHTNFSLWLA